MRLKLKAKQHRFLNSEAMTMYIVSRLEGAALRQIAAFVTGAAVNVESPAALLTYLETSFGDPDPIGTARRELHELKQTKDFGAYLTEFRRIMGRLNYDNNAQMDALDQGLSPKLKDALVFTTRPATMAEYENQLLVLDNKLKAREEETKGSRNQMGQFIAPAPISSFTPGGLAPMDLSATLLQNRNNTPRPPLEQRHYLVNRIRRITPAVKTQ